MVSDFSAWPEIAFMIRRLALNTTPDNANTIVDKVFSNATDKKYYSHVWAFLPTSVINHLALGTYRAADLFDENTEFPDIRSQIIAQLERDPSAPYSEFLLYTLGRFSEAVKLNPNSPIHSVLSYALGHSTLREILSGTFDKIAQPGDRAALQDGIVYYSYKYDLRLSPPYTEPTLEEKYASLADRDFFRGHAYENIPWSNDEYRDNQPSLTQYINYFNKFPERYNSEPLVDTIPSFESATDAVLMPLEEVLKDRSSPHYDDAAYLLGWLAYHRGYVDQALDRFGSLIGLLPTGGSNGTDYFEPPDYAGAALTQVYRIFRTLPPTDVINRIQNSEVLSSQSIIWDVALTSFYHMHQFKLVMAGARQALHRFDITLEDFPVTTDDFQIEEVLVKLQVPKYAYFADIVYLYNAARELTETEEMLDHIDQYSVNELDAHLREIVFKYSLLTDSDLKAMWSAGDFISRHKDLRQSIFIATKSLERLPRTHDYSKLREWLHYRRIRLLAQFNPVEMSRANSEFQDEFPQSSLLDDGMAEQIFAEAVIVGDMEKAAETFDSLRKRYPRSNALDNAYSWMAIGWTCSGQPVKALEVDQEIIRLFPLTRHARFARERSKTPKLVLPFLSFINGTTRRCYGVNEIGSTLYRLSPMQRLIANLFS